MNTTGRYENDLSREDYLENEISYMHEKYLRYRMLARQKMLLCLFLGMVLGAIVVRTVDYFV